MVGISNSERKRRADIAELEEKLKQDMPLYVFKGLRGNLNTLLRKQEKAEAERKAKTQEQNARKRAKQIRDMGFIACDHLPRNGREPPDGYVAPPGMYFDLGAFLDANPSINRKAD